MQMFPALRILTIRQIATVFFSIWLIWPSSLMGQRESDQLERVGSDQVFDKMAYVHPIPFLPKRYLCYRIDTSLRIDGKLDEAAWSVAPWTDDFVDIEGSLKPLPKFRTKVKMLWDEKYFYFGALLEESHLWATLRQRDTIIYHNDDFEIFIDPDGDAHNYYEFEMNAYNTVWDLLLLWPYHLRRGPNIVFNWNNPGLITAVHLEGTLNDPSDIDEYWSVEIAFPWQSLRELATGRRLPKPGDQWRVNFSRVEWHLQIKDDQYVKRIDSVTHKLLPVENWVWSPTGRIDMHRPETWGFVQFSGGIVGEEQDSFAPNPEDKVKWALWQLFYQQQAFRQKYKKYTAKIEHFTIPVVEGHDFQPKFFAGAGTFEIIAPAAGKGVWHIDHTGRIWKD